ncbi:MAG TPA: cyclase family protein [Robiginitalea sp.]|nr:cyclase family protein [Robiginitalea sp.]
MELQITLADRIYLADLGKPIDCSVPVTPKGVTAWGLGPARVNPHQEGDFTGSVAAGASVNFNDICFNPHAHGTHTECLGHITPVVHSVNEEPPPPLMPARLITLKPMAVEGGHAIGAGQLANALPGLQGEAVILRTHFSNAGLFTQAWSGTNPPYLRPEAAAWLAERGVRHLLLDLPSVDPEQDGGALAAHKAFWGLPGHARHGATITELIAVPASAKDGLYLLNLQMAALENDACPSRPVLFKLNPL